MYERGSVCRDVAGFERRVPFEKKREECGEAGHAEQDGGPVVCGGADVLMEDDGDEKGHGDPSGGEGEEDAEGVHGAQSGRPGRACRVWRRGMNWINIDVALPDCPQMLGAGNEELGIWLRLMRYCCVQENGGRIAGAALFSPMAWIVVAQVEAKRMREKALLWSWDGDDLEVFGYPSAKEGEVKAKREIARENGQKGGRPKKPKENQRETKQKPTLETNGKPTGKAEGKGREGKGKEMEEDARGSLSDFPDSLSVPEAGALMDAWKCVEALVGMNPAWDSHRVRAVIGNALQICPDKKTRAEGVKAFVEELMVMEERPDTFPLPRFKGFMRKSAEAGQAEKVMETRDPTNRRFQEG
jgi:hypothetical protein